MNDYIIVFSRHIDNWGAERSTCSLCKGLIDKGYNVLVIIPSKEAIIDLLTDLKIPYLVYNFYGWLYEGKRKPRFRHILKLSLKEFLGLYSLRRKIKQMGINPILVYSNTITFRYGIRFAKLCGIPHVQHIRENIDAFDYHFIYGYEKSMKIINTSSAIMCTCDTIRNRYLPDLDAAKFCTVHNGVPPIELLPLKDFHQETLEIVQVARFMDDKRVIDSLNAMKILIYEKKINNIHLDIFGKGEEEDIYKNFISENNLNKYVSIKGFVSKIDFKPYHVGLMTSTFEAFSRSVLDYMNNGLTVIASRAGGNVEQVVDGETGLLYEVKNPYSLANAILVLNTDRDKLQIFACNSRKRYLDNFTQDRYVSKTNEIIIKSLR